MKIFYHYLSDFQRLILLTAFTLYLGGGVVYATVYTVNNPADGTGINQLRGALVQAGNTSGTHTINISAGTYYLDNGQISFGTANNCNITIIGAGPGSTIIDAKNNSRGFNINSAYSKTNLQVTITNLTMQNCYSVSGGGGGAVSFMGGVGNNLSLDNCMFQNNTASSGGTTPVVGGAILCVDAMLSINNSTFTSNTCNDGPGGAVRYECEMGYLGLATAGFSITNSRFSFNSTPAAETAGGAIQVFNYGSGGTFSGKITGCSFVQNSASDGVAGAVHIQNHLSGATLSINYNRFFGNTGKPGFVGTAVAIQGPNSIADVQNNWWGCNDGANGCADNGYTEGNAANTFTPHLQMKTTLSVQSVCADVGNSTQVTSGFTSNSANQSVAASNLTALVGISVARSGHSGLGSLSGIQTTIQSNGLSTATLISNGTPGIANIVVAVGGFLGQGVPMTFSAPGTWLGTSSADWDEPANWCGGVPTASTNVIIRAGKPFAPVISSSSAMANNIVIETGASLSLAAGATFDVKGNVTNSGAFSADAEFTFVSFSGASDQTIPGGIYDVLSISGGANKILSGDATVKAVMMFFGSKLALGNNTLTLGTAAEISGASATAHFVTNGTGGVKKNNIGFEAFTFPIGSGTGYAPVMLTNSGTIDDFTARVGDGIYASYVNNVPQGSPVTSKAVNKTWYLTEAVQGESNVVLSLYWYATDELPSFGGGCFVSHYGNNGWDSIIYGPASGTNPSFKTRSGITSFSPFGVLNAGSPLPVTLSRFEAVREGSTALLSWSTTEETNSDRFEVERSTNGKNWQKIGSVRSNGESRVLTDYRFVDVYPIPSQENLYRLRMVDVDDTFAYSRIRSVKFNGIDNSAVFPNPVSDKLFVRDFANVSNMHIQDMNGKVVYKSGTMENDGIKVNKLSTGLHLVEIKWLDGSKTVQKVAIE